MKKTLVILSFAGSGMFISSCVKERDCTCIEQAETENAIPVTTTETTTEANCADLNETWEQNGVDVSRTCTE